MTLHLINAAAIAPQAWRNGGGQTRELLTWPAGGAWQLRISRADIAADGPFSAFPGVRRWFAVLSGAGVRLSLPDGDRQLSAADEALCFDGACAPGCRLLDGPTQDLNLMARAGRGAMHKARPGEPWHSSQSVRALYTALAGHWNNRLQSRALPAHSLLWSDAADGAAWTFTPAQPDATDGAWWLGFTPDANG